MRAQTDTRSQMKEMVNRRTWLPESRQAVRLPNTHGWERSSDG